MSETKYINALSVKSGFFNSKEGTHDRMYNAEDMSSIFDGLILDGVYADLGDRFVVKSKGGLSVTIGSGRAWFNNTWFVNKALVVKQLDDAIPNPAFGRFDIIGIEVNLDSEVRETRFFYTVGDAATDYKKPELIHDEYVNQYPIAYIEFTPGTESITDANIENVVGTDVCPFVTGILEHTDINDLLAGWNAKAEEMLANNTKEFQEWFDSTREHLDSDVAGHLQNEIEQLNNRLNAFGDAEELMY